jgi:hypothetical protein
LTHDFARNPQTKTTSLTGLKVIRVELHTLLKQTLLLNIRQTRSRIQHLDGHGTSTFILFTRIRVDSYRRFVAPLRKPIPSYYTREMKQRNEDRPDNNIKILLHTLLPLTNTELLLGANFNAFDSIFLKTKITNNGKSNDHSSKNQLKHSELLTGSPDPASRSHQGHIMTCPLSNPSVVKA